jgi:hypothetical protein
VFSKVCYWSTSGGCTDTVEMSTCEQTMTPPSRRIRMTTEKNRALIRHLFEDVLNGGKMDVVDEIISAEYVECCPRRSNGY